MLVSQNRNFGSFNDVFLLSLNPVPSFNVNTKLDMTGAQTTLPGGSWLVCGDHQPQE